MVLTPTTSYRDLSLSLTGKSGIALRLQDILSKDLPADFAYYLDRTPGAFQQVDDQGRPLLIQLVVNKAYKSAVVVFKRDSIGDVDCRDRNGLTALHHASADGAVEVIDKLLEKGASPYSKNHEGISPLHIALKTENVEVVRRLTYAGLQNREQYKRQRADHFAPNSHTLLHVAASSSNECLNFLLQVTDDNECNSKDPEGRTALHYAVLSDYAVKNTFTLAQQEYVNKDIADRHGETPLGMACRLGRDEVASILLANGADPNIGAVPPIVTTYLKGFRDISLLLIAKGANPDTKWGKNTLLEVAYAREDMDTANLLLLKGATQTPAYQAMKSMRERAEVSFTGGSSLPRIGSFTVKDLEAKKHLSSLHELVCRSDIDLQLLLKYTKGKDWKITNEQGMTPFLSCVRFGPIQNIAALFCSDSCFDAKDKEGNGAMHHALHSEYPAVFYFLVTHLKPFVNQTNRKGQTALHLAALRGDFVAMEVLLRADADSSLLDAEKNSLFHIIAAHPEATFKKFEHIVNQLNGGKAVLDLPNRDGDTATFLAWKKGNKRALYKFLELGANPDIPDAEGYTILTRACKASDETTCEHLVLAGADRNAKGPETALMAACSIGQRKIVLLLLNKRIGQSKEKDKIAHPNRGNEQRTPLSITIEELHRSFSAQSGTDIKSLSHYQILQDLLRAGVNVNKSVKIKQQKITPLGLAVEKKMPDVVKIFLEHKAKVDKGEPKPLERACKAESTEIAKILLQNKAKVPRTLKKNRTLTQAAEQNPVVYESEEDSAAQSSDDTSAQNSTYSSKQGSPRGSRVVDPAHVSAEEIILRLELLNKRLAD